MDNRRFDSLARALTTARSRRSLAGLAVGGLLAGAGVAGAAGCGPCERRRGNRCRPKRDGASCNGSGLCVARTCRPRPTCAQAGATCTGAIDCCGGCRVRLGETTGICATGAAGDRCRAGGDCASGACHLFRCQ